MNDVTDAALGLIGLSPSFLPPPSPTVPTKRKQAHERAPATPVFVTPLEQGEYEGIDCICGFSYDDGFSIQCDKCERWVHGVCYGIVNAEEVDGCSWMCLSCEPRVVDVERAKKIQIERKRSMDARRSSAPGASTNHRGRGGGGGAGKTRRPSAVAHVDGHGKKKRRPSIINASTSVSSQLDDEHIDVGDAWTQSYVPITHDVISSQETREKLQRHAQNWRGVTALASPQPESLTTVKPVAVPASPYANPAVRPPSFGLHTTAPISSESLITPYTSNITPSATYLSDPLNAYAQMGVPKPFVHLIGQPLDVALDSRWQGDTSRFARSGCRPNAVLRPMVCSRSPDNQDKDDILSFGVFALRDLKANEEVVLGWEWDDGSAIHHLPAAIQSQHLFNPDELNFLRKQLSVVLHTLNSTFTTCACGSKARDCAIALASTFIDADLSQPPPTSSPGAGPSTLPPIDLGPLVGTQRGFRTREKLPHSGGIGGVEMCDDPAPSNWKGKGKARAMDSPVDMDSPVVVDDDEEDMGGRVQGYGHKHRRFSTNESPHPNRTTRRLPKKRNRADLLPPPDISPPPMLPPRPPEDEDTDDGRMDVDVDAEVELKMPPKMRKKWIHSSADTLKKIRAESGGEEEGMGLGLSVSMPSISSSSSLASTAASSSSSSTMTPFSGHGTTGAHVVIGDDATNPQTPMPPPPMPASLDPTTVSSIPPPSSTSSLPSLSPRPSPRPTLGTFDLLPAFTGGAGPSKGPAFNPTTSPTTSFSKLSLLSPVVLHGSPPLGGRGSGAVNPSSSTTASSPISSNVTTIAATVTATSPSPSSSLAPTSPYAIPGLLSTREADVGGSDMPVVEREEPRHDQPTMLDVPSSPRVRFVSPPSVDLPASFQRRSSPLRTVVASLTVPETSPPLESDGAVREPPSEDVAMDSVSAEVPAAEALVSTPAREGHVPSTPPSIELSPPSLIPPPLAPATVMADVAMDTDITVVDQPSSSLEPPPPPHLSSTSPPIPSASLPPPSALPRHEVFTEPQAEPTPTEEPTPTRTPTPPPPPPPQKVKLSLKDFAMRRKRQREEEAKNSPVIAESALLPVELGREKEEGKEGPVVAGAGVVSGADEGTDGSGNGGREPGGKGGGDAMNMTVDVEVKVEPEKEKEQQVDVPRAHSDLGSRRLSEATTHSDSNETDHTPPSSTPPLTPCTPPRDCTHTPPPLSPSRSRSPTPPQAQSQLHVHEKENEQPMSLQAKIEVVEHVLPADYSRPFGSSNCGPGSPVLPPPPSSLLSTPIAIPVYPDAYRGHHRRPSSQEDGEITSSRSEASSPPPLPPPPASSQPSRPPSQPPPSSIPPAGPKAYGNGTNGSYTPRVNTPPLGPRFHAGAGYSPPGGRWPSSTPTASSSASSSHATTSVTGAKRPPSAPRASRGYAQSYTPSYPPPPRSASSHSSHGQQYLPRGPSADRDRMDWDRDRSWSRPRGRGSGGNWGR